MYHRGKEVKSASIVLRGHRRREQVKMASQQGQYFPRESALAQLKRDHANTSVVAPPSSGSDQGMIHHIFEARLCDVGLAVGRWAAIVHPSSYQQSDLLRSSTSATATNSAAAAICSPTHVRAAAECLPGRHSTQHNQRSTSTRGEAVTILPRTSSPDGCFRETARARSICGTPSQPTADFFQCQ